MAHVGRQPFPQVPLPHKSPHSTSVFIWLGVIGLESGHAPMLRCSSHVQSTSPPSCSTSRECLIIPARRCSINVTPVKRPCILSFKSYAPVLRTLRKQTLGLRECDWTLSHIWCLIIRDIELSTTDLLYLLYKEENPQKSTRTIFCLLVVVRNGVRKILNHALRVLFCIAPPLYCVHGQ